jgi:diguanylate cyclase (GGDEF)-like protein
MAALRTIDRYLARLSPVGALAIATAGTLVVGVLDYLNGYEISFSLFYLAPVAMATWYSGPRGGFAVAALSCVSWFAADVIAEHPYSHPAIPIWNALVRFGFFAVVSALIGVYQGALRNLRILARTDPLTGLATRRSFEETLAHDFALARRRGTAVSLAYLDLDDFKTVNDASGHAEGDLVLRAVGEVLHRSLREVDTAARLGGDEFAIVLPDTGAEGAVHVLNDIAAVLRRAFMAAQWPIDCSIGVVTFANARVGLDAALAAADRAMYEAKHAGKGMVVGRVFEEDHAQP